MNAFLWLLTELALLLLALQEVRASKIQKVCLLRLPLKLQIAEKHSGGNTSFLITFFSCESTIYCRLMHVLK